MRPLLYVGLLILFVGLVSARTGGSGGWGRTDELDDEAKDETDNGTNDELEGGAEDDTENGANDDLEGGPENDNENNPDPEGDGGKPGCRWVCDADDAPPADEKDPPADEKDPPANKPDPAPPGGCECPPPPAEDLHSCAVWVSANSVFRMGGGTIVSPTTVITSAHLLTLALGDVELVQVQYYEDDFNSDILTVHPTFLVIHAAYNALTSLNDIGIVRFAAETFPLGNAIYLDFELQALSVSGFVSGFGQDATGQISRIPRRVAQTIVECTTDILIENGASLCASEEDVRMCAGQNGSGLIVETSEKRTLVGIVSIIQNGCNPGQQTGFTSIESQAAFLSMFQL